MTTQELADMLQAKLHPEPYGRKMAPGFFKFLLMRNSALTGGRYAFAFGQLESDNVAASYRRARAEARRITKSMWLFQDVGLYLMFSGPGPF